MGGLPWLRSRLAGAPGIHGSVMPLNSGAVLELSRVAPLEAAAAFTYSGI